MASSDAFRHPLSVITTLLIAAAALAACDGATRINSDPSPAARSYDCDTRGACGTFRLGAPNTDTRSIPGPSGEEFRRDAPAMR